MAAYNKYACVALVLVAAVAVVQSLPAGPALAAPLRAAPAKNAADKSDLTADHSYGLGYSYGGLYGYPAYSSYSYGYGSPYGYAYSYPYYSYGGLYGGYGYPYYG